MADIPANDARLEELEVRLDTTRAQLHDLAMMGAVVTSIQEIDAVLSVVMDMAIRLVNGEVGMIMLEDEEQLRVEVSWGVGEDLAKSLMYLDGMDLPTYCHRIGQTVVLNQLGIQAENGLLINSVMSLPIKTSQRSFGVMVIINEAGGSSFTDEHREALEMLLNFVAVAVDNHHMVQAMLDRQKAEQEMAIARQIQETILPQDIDRVQGAEIGAAYFPMGEVGGDFYDVLPVDDNTFVVVLGDVSSHGVPAALVMSAASGMIKTIISHDPAISMADLASHLNDLLAAQIIKEREMFVTLFFCRFDLTERKLTYCNAGHLPGLLWDQKEGRIIELSVGGPIVGQFEGLPFQLGEHPLHPGDRLFLFTDGLTEAMDENGAIFGRERAEQVFSVEIGLPPSEFCQRVKEWVDNFAAGAAADQQDDFTILQVKVD
jgi:sigma-B regulation protein RsbU (phosphoserine phosphatase)